MGRLVDEVILTWSTRPPTDRDRARHDGPAHEVTEAEGRSGEGIGPRDGLGKLNAAWGSRNAATALAGALRGVYASNSVSRAFLLLLVIFNGRDVTAPAGANRTAWTHSPGGAGASTSDPGRPLGGRRRQIALARHTWTCPTWTTSMKPYAVQLKLPRAGKARRLKMRDSAGRARQEPPMSGLSCPRDPGRAPGTASA